jgi:hypothetical protein
MSFILLRTSQIHTVRQISCGSKSVLRSRYMRTWFSGRVEFTSFLLVPGFLLTLFSSLPVTSRYFVLPLPLCLFGFPWVRKNPTSYRREGWLRAQFFWLVLEMRQVRILAMALTNLTEVYRKFPQFFLANVVVPYNSALPFRFTTFPIRHSLIVLLIYAVQSELVNDVFRWTSYLSVSPYVATPYNTDVHSHPFPSSTVPNEISYTIVVRIFIAYQEDNKLQDKASVRVRIT